jgi:hypothetical protein
MTWLEQWRALASRIDGLIRAGEFLISAFRVNSGDTFSVVRNSFLPELAAITAEIEHLGKIMRAKSLHRPLRHCKGTSRRAGVGVSTKARLTFRRSHPSPLFVLSSSTSSETPRPKGETSRSWHLSISGDFLWWMSTSGQTGRTPSRDTKRPAKGLEQSTS